MIFSDVSCLLSRTRQWSGHVFRIHHVLPRHPNQPILVDHHRHVDDVLYFRHRFRYRCHFSLPVSAGNQKQNHDRSHVKLNGIVTGRNVQSRLCRLARRSRCCLLIHVSILYVNEYKINGNVIKYFFSLSLVKEPEF